MITRSRAPARLSFASCGDTDYYMDLIGTGNALNATIDLFSYCEIHKRLDNKIILRSLETGAVVEANSLEELTFEDRGVERGLELMKAVVKHYGNTGIEVVTYTDIPIGSGLGGSAAHTVSLIKAFDELNKFQKTNEEIAKLAYHLERNVVKIAGGYQDQYSSAFRGMNYMEFSKGGQTAIAAIPIRSTDLETLEKNLLLVYIPREKVGKDVHQEQKEKREINLPLLAMKRENVKEVRKALEERRFSDFGKLIHHDWKIKKQLADSIANQRVEKVYQTALDAGSIGGRFIGAGAGGCALFYCDGNREKVLNALLSLGVKEIKFNFERVSNYRINMDEKIHNQIQIHHEIIGKMMNDQQTKVTIANIAKKIVECYKNGGNVIVFGNGGSAADAQHIVGELVNYFRIPSRPMLNATALTVNTSVMTAIANDTSYDNVFARQIETLARHGDVVIGISTSGKAENVLRALKKAKERDAFVVYFTGATGGRISEEMKNQIDISLKVPSTDTPRIQEAHIMSGHIICELVEEELYGK